MIVASLVFLVLLAGFCAATHLLAVDGAYANQPDLGDYILSAFLVFLGVPILLGLLAALVSISAAFAKYIGAV